MATVTHADQLKHARAVEAYWHGKGKHNVKVWVAEEKQEYCDERGYKRTITVPAIKSNLVNGMPPL